VYVPWVVRHREGFKSDSNHSSCTLRLALRGNLLGAGRRPRDRKNPASSAVAPPTARLAPRRKLLAGGGGGEPNGGPR
jgi:hypothetical protein